MAPLENSPISEDSFLGVPLERSNTSPFWFYDWLIPLLLGIKSLVSLVFSSGSLLGWTLRRTMRTFSHKRPAWSKGITCTSVCAKFLRTSCWTPPLNSFHLIIFYQIFKKLYWFFNQIFYLILFFFNFCRRIILESQLKCNILTSPFISTEFYVG